MNLQSFKEFNRFKELVTSKQPSGWQDEIKALEDIKNAESLPVDACIAFGRRFVVCGLIDNSRNARPIVYDHSEKPEYPNPIKLAFFRKIDLSQNLIELQDTIDVVSDLNNLNLIEKPFRPDIIKLYSVFVVYGKALKKGTKLVPHLTLAEVTTQLGLQCFTSDEMLWYVCDTAEECGELTTYAGYHAYRIALYKPAWLPETFLPELTIDDYAAE